MFCFDCGKQIADGSSFCEYCGSPQNNKGPMRPGSQITGLVPAKCCNCGANIEVDRSQDAAICSACGTPFIVEKAINLYISGQIRLSDYVIVGGVLKKYRGADIDIVIPEGVFEIEAGAFDECKYLNSIVFPNSLVNLSGCQFSNCEKLSKVIFKGQLQHIGDSAFFNCELLETVEFPENLRSIGKNVFQWCRSLKNIYLPDKLVSIGESAFSHCISLTDIKYPDSLKTIGCKAFEGCQKLKYIEFPNNLERIESHAFESCSSLTNVKFPDKLKSLNNGVFYRCKSLETVKLPDSMQIISPGLFEECVSLTKIVIPSKLKKIGQNAFKDCRSLTNIVLPATLENIGSGSFDGCSALSDIKLPNNLNTIEEFAFSNCNSLKEIHIPKNTVFDVYAFANNPKVRVFLPNTVDQVTRLWIAAEKCKIAIRNRTEDDDFFARYLLRETKENITKNNGFDAIFVGTTFLKNHEILKTDVSVYYFAFYDDFLSKFVGYGMNGRFDSSSNYDGFSTDIDNDRTKLKQLFDYAGIKNYTIETIQAPIVQWTGGILTGRYVKRGKRNFLRVKIPLNV